MDILALIPARGGSKGVPGKNIKMLAGKPLIAYTAETALKAIGFKKVVLSTDDPAIAEVGRKYGLEVPFMRPAELAQDTTPTLPVVQHALRHYQMQGEQFDAVCLLQATNPLRSLADIDACIKKFVDGNYDSVFSVLQVPDEVNPYWTYLEDEDGMMHLSTGGTEPITRRQALPKAYHREGSIYITKTSVVLNENSLYGKHIGGQLVSSAHQINIDTMQDWAKAEEYFKNKE